MSIPNKSLSPVINVALQEMGTLIPRTVTDYNGTIAEVAEPLPPNALDAALVAAFVAATVSDRVAVVMGQVQLIKDRCDVILAENAAGRALLDPVPPPAP